VREDSRQDKRLVAYVVAKAGTELAERELRHALQAKLPEYMVPSIFVSMQELPLTPNGKIDRHSLPETAQVSSALAHEFVAPRDPVEMEIAEIWEALLERTPIGIHDNFFELGGHSLLATQFIARLRSTFQVDLSLRSFFSDPTVSGIAQAIEEVLLGEPDVDAPSHGVSKENYV